MVCKRIQSATKVITGSTLEKDTEVIICHTGTNDSDSLDTLDVVDSLIDLNEIITQKFPNTRLLVSSLLPREDSLQNEVKLCNQRPAKAFSPQI